MRVLATALTLIAALAAAGPAAAQDARGRASAQASEALSGRVLIVLASNAEGSIDPRLANVPALRRPPFDSYRSMELLSSPSIQLRAGQAEEIELPNGRRIRIALREVTNNGRLRLQVSINRPGQQDYLPEMNVVASPGDPFFVAGQSFRNGTLVIGIQLGDRR